MRAFVTFCVLTALVPGVAACGGGNDDANSGTGNAAAPLTAAEWRTQADAICSEAKTKLDALEAPTANGEIVPFLNDGLAITRERITAFEKLTPPAELADASREAVRLQKDTNDKISAAIAKIEAGTSAEAAFQEFDAAITKNGNDLDALAKEAGLKVCGAD
jgi:hypothetical protein